jgi:Rad3-related DNA helicase
MHIRTLEDCIGRQFEDYYTIDEFNKDLVKSVLVRIKKQSIFKPDKPKNLAFPKDNFLRTQMDYDGYNNETI